MIQTLKYFKCPVRNRLLLNQYSFLSSSASSINKTETQDDNPSKLVITQKCVERLKKVMNKNEVLRIEVEGGGCQGFNYKINLDDQINSDDETFEKDGIKVVVDNISLNYIKGSILDYSEELIRSSFKIINNPQADKGCSCGSLFTIKLD